MLERRLLTFGDDMTVTLYAGDIRRALVSARDFSQTQPDRFRLEYDWKSGGMKVTDGREHLRPTGDAGMLGMVSFVLGRIREDDLRDAEAAAEATATRLAELRGPAPACKPAPSI